MRARTHLEVHVSTGTAAADHQSCAMEALEDRQLLASWGAIPQLINQPALVASRPNLNGAGRSIAVIDTGVNYKSSVLGGGYGPGNKVVAGWNYIDNNSNIMDTDGHGTAVAGLLAGNTYYYNGQRYQGIAPKANIVALKVDDGVNDVPDSRIINALTYVIKFKAKYNIVAVNIDEGGTTQSWQKASGAYTSQLQTLQNMGVFVGVAAGNEGSAGGVDYPASDPYAFSVGSVDTSDSISSFTDTGPSLDFLAPGENVPAPWVDSSGRPTFNSVSGTSFATPFAVGAAALLNQFDSRYSVTQIQQILQFSGVSDNDPVTGLTFKRLDLTHAFNTATWVSAHVSFSRGK